MTIRSPHDRHLRDIRYSRAVAIAATVGTAFAFVLLIIVVIS